MISLMNYDSFEAIEEVREYVHHDSVCSTAGLECSQKCYQVLELQILLLCHSNRIIYFLTIITIFQAHIILNLSSNEMQNERRNWKRQHCPPTVEFIMALVCDVTVVLHNGLLYTDD